MISLITDISNSSSKNYILFLSDLINLLIPRLSDKKQDVRSSIVLLLSNFIFNSIEYDQAQNLIDKCLNDVLKYLKVPFIVQSMLQLLQELVKEKAIRRNISVSRMLPFVLEQYATSLNITTKTEALNTLLLFYQFTGQKLKQDVIKRAKAYDFNKMDSLYRQFENMQVIEDHTTSTTHVNGVDEEMQHETNTNNYNSNKILMNGHKSKLPTKNVSNENLIAGAYDIESMRVGMGLKENTTVYLSQN